MANLYDRVKKKATNKAYQNRVNRATKKAKEYNNGKLNKTQQNYVKGDIKSSSSTRAWGYKTNGTLKEDYFQTSFTGGRNKSRYEKQQKGENPYELKYIYTGKPTKVQGGTRADGTKYDSYTTKKRFLTDKEKEVYKATGGLDVKSYDEKNKYNIMSSSNKDAKTFKEHSNVFDTDGKFKWDGMEVAKNRVKNGKSKWNYVGGFLKDTVVDPVVRGLQYVDMLTSAGMGGFMGAVEEGANAFEAIADEKKTLKDNVNLGRIADNFKASIENSNKTGWGKSAGEYFDEMTMRNTAKERQRILESDQYTEEHKKKLLANLDEVENSGKHKAFRSIAGLGMDVVAPVDLGAGAVKGTKNAVKSLTKGDNVVNFVPKASQELIETGRKHQDMLERMKAYKNYLQEEYIPKFGKNVDEAKAWKGFEDSRFAEEYAQKIGYEANGIDQGINRMLDNGFNRAMASDTTVKEVTNVVKSNPQTQNLGRFLDEIGTNVDKGVQKHIDGRKLNAKRTQVKDGYVPQMLRNTDEVAENIGKVDNNQLSFDSLSRIENKYESIYNSNKLDDVFEYIDELDDVEADSMLDWLKSRDPLAYKKYMSGADTIDDFADTGVNVNKIKSKAYDKQIKEITSTKPRNNIKFDVAKTDAMKEENAIEKLAKLFSDEATSKTYKNSIERNKAFREYVGQFSDDLFNGKVDIDDLSNTIKQVRGKDVPAKVKREFINNKLFGGNNVISSSVSNSSIDAFLESLEDISSLKRVANEYMKTGEILPVQLSSATKKFLNIGDDLKIKGGKVRGDKIDSPEDLLRTLTNSIYDRSRALTDERYGEKLQLMAKNFGYEDYYRDVVSKLDDLTSELKSLDKLPVTKENLSRKLELSENIKRLKQIKADRTKMWESIKNLPESNFDKYISEVYPQHMKGMNAYSHKANQIKELDNMAKGSDNVLNDVYNKMFDEKMEKARLTFNDVVPEEPEKSLVVAINKKAKRKGLDNKSLSKAHEFKRNLREVERLSEYNQKLSDFSKSIDVELPKKTSVKIKLAKNQTLGSLPPVRDNLNNLKKLIKKEVEEMYTNPKAYSENKQMYANLKKEFINGLRSYGVPDNAYFEKATNLRKLTEETLKKNINKKVDSLLDNYKPTGGKGSKELKMNLQLLASKVDEMFDELGKADIDSLSKTVGSPQSVSNEALDKIPQGKLKTFLNGISEKLEGSDLSKENIETILESKKKRYLRNNGVAELNNPLHKTYHVTDGELPVKSAKRLDNGNVIDFATGETKYSSANKGEFKDILEQNKYHYKNLEENDILADFIVSGKQDVSTMTTMFDRLNIKYDLNNPKSIDKAVNRLDWIIDKKMKEGVIDLDKAQRKLDGAVKGSYTKQVEKDFAKAIDDNALKKEIREKNKIMDSIKRKQLKLADKGIDPNVVENKAMRKRMRANQYSKQTNIDVDKATAKQKDMQNIIEKEKNRKVSKDVLDKFNKKGTMLDEIKEGKRKKSANLKEAEKRVAENIELDKKMDKLINKSKSRDKVNETVSKNAEQMLKNEASPKAIGEQLDKDIRRMEEDGSLFKKFKEWYADGNDVAYDNNAIYDVYKRWLNSWKKGLTVYNPGWHVKNFFQNKGQSYLGLGMDAFGSQKQARQVLKEVQGKANKANHVVDMKNGKIYSPQDVSKLAQELGVVDGLGNEVRQARGLIPKLETFVDNSNLMKTIGQSEETARLHHFIKKLERGYSPEEASKSVNKYLFDYSKQSKFDRVMGDFIDPFWIYHKNNARLMTAQGIENADKVANTYRGLRGMQDDVQGEDKASVMYRDIQSPVGSFVDSKNKDRYNYQYNLDLFPEVDGAVPIEKDDIMSKLNPILKIAYQQSQGLGSFDNKIVDKEVADWGEVTKKERNEEIFSEVNPFMNPLVKAMKKSKDHDSRAKEGKQSQETSNKQILMDWLEYIFGNKGNYYRDVR